MRAYKHKQNLIKNFNYYKNVKNVSIYFKKESMQFNKNV